MRTYNFSAGPAVLPETVLERIRADIPDLDGSGMSVMEISHRSPAFARIAEQAEEDLRALLAIPADYAVLFLQGGATAQFSAVPLNLCAPSDQAAYVLTGSWGRKAAKEAQRYCQVHIAADAADSNYTAIPPVAEWSVPKGAAYVHITPNETIGGVEFHSVPDIGDVPLIGDISSTILSRPIDVSRYGVLYAGAQKNIGPAGLTVVIVRKDLLGHARAETPSMLNYAAMAESGSMLNTPPTFAWYAAGLVFQWLREQGGLEAVARRNKAKADKLYSLIDASAFYSNPVAPAARSWMNIPFTLARPELDADFLAGSGAAGLQNLKGHRSVGGMRASIYNAMPESGVDALISFMQKFEQANA